MVGDEPPALRLLGSAADQAHERIRHPARAAHLEGHMNYDIAFTAEAAADHLLQHYRAGRWQEDLTPKPLPVPPDYQDHPSPDEAENTAFGRLRKSGKSVALTITLKPRSRYKVRYGNGPAQATAGAVAQHCKRILDTTRELQAGVFAGESGSASASHRQRRSAGHRG